MQINSKEWLKHKEYELGRGKKKATDNQVKCAYKKHGSVWKAADELGMCGQSIQERLKRMGVKPIERSGINTYSSGVRGWWEGDGKRYYMRSQWEMNYACYLVFLKKQKLIKEWEYEVDTFWFKKIKRGVRSYKPDFKIFNNDDTIEYHEVKGWMDAKSKTKLKRMKIYYPKIKIVLINKKAYMAIKKTSGLYKGWVNQKD